MKKNDILMMIISDFQLRSFVDPKPVELGESYVYTSKPRCLIAQIRLGVSVH